MKKKTFIVWTHVSPPTVRHEPQFRKSTTVPAMATETVTATDTRPPAPVQRKLYTVYFLQSGRRSYIGFTVNLVRRVRQHRGELKGGAKYTAHWPDRRHLTVVACIQGFPTKHAALSYEWHAKRRPRERRWLPRELGAHHRLAGFFRPLTTAKFADLTPLLRVRLFQHHGLAPVLVSRFDRLDVRCEML